MNNIKQKVYLCIIFSFVSCLVVFSQSRSISAKLSLKEIFEPGADLSNGIIGTVSGGGKISVQIRETTNNTLVYESYILVSSTTYNGIGTDYSKSQLGAGGKYYPDKWNSEDIKSAAYAIDLLKAETATKPYSFLTNPIDVKVDIVEEGTARVGTMKIPGLGIINWEGGNQLFDSRHFCYDIKNSDDCTCRAWKKFKTPRLDKDSDILIAAHRGVWGYDLGNGYPENSTTSISAVNEYAQVLETDVMITKDDKVLVSHDYNLLRLTNYSGTDRDYVWNMNSSALKGLKIRKRNDDISGQNLILFDDLVDLLIKNQIVVNVDIKEIRARNKNGVCIDNCDYDPKTHGQEARDKIQASWKKIFKTCYDVAKSKNALQYISFKIPFDRDFLNDVLTEEEAAKVLFLPVIQPRGGDKALEAALSFVDSWNSKAGINVCAYETNFKDLSSPYLNQFIREGREYINLLHYVYDQTGLRGGGYPDEPSGPKGVSNRFSEWSAKNLSKDIRGNHYLLMSVPYVKISVMTTDRPDIWLNINALYNK